MLFNSPPIYYSRRPFNNRLQRLYSALHHHHTVGPPSLRPYQQECIDTCLDEYRRGVRRQAVSLPVGSGKTVIFANLIQQLPNPTPFATKTLVLAHREELLLQAKRQIERHAPHLRVCIEMGANEADPLADVIVASVPTLGRQGSGMERLERRFDPQRFKCIVIDEAHHSAAVTYCRILEYFGVIGPELVVVAEEAKAEAVIDSEEDQDLKDELFGLMETIKQEKKGEVEMAKEESNAESNNNNNNNAIEQPAPPTSSHILLWGCSATLSRNDQLDLGRVFEKVAYHVPFTRMIEEGWLCPLRLFQVSTDVDLEDISIRRGDYDMEELSLAIDTPARNDMVVATWKREAVEEHQRQATIVFALNIAHVNNLARSFAKIGVSAAIITGTTPEGLRAETLRRFAAGQIPVLINCAVLTEGTDLPITDCVLLTRPTCNDNLYIQMIGRGLRRHEGKQYCLVLDVIDRNRTGERSLINLPSLFALKEPPRGDDGEGLLGGPKTPEKPRRRGELDPEQVNVSVAELEQPMQTFTPQRVLPWIRISSDQLIFAHYGQYYVLDVDAERTSCRITLIKEEDPGVDEKTEGEGEDDDGIKMRIGIRTNKSSKRGFQRIPITPAADQTPIGEALRILYRYLETSLSPKGSTALHQCRATAGWRRRVPPTEGQFRMLSGIGMRLGMRADDLSGLRVWTVGRAHHVISKYQYMTQILRIPPWHLPPWPQMVEGVKNYS